MDTAQLDYWLECVQQSAEEHKISMSQTQAEALAADIKVGYENYGLAFYSPPMRELPVFKELEEVKKALAREQESRGCPECRGSGSYWSQGPHHGCSRDCHKCNGKGKIYFS